MKTITTVEELQRKWNCIVVTFNDSFNGGKLVRATTLGSQPYNVQVVFSDADVRQTSSLTLENYFVRHADEEFTKFFGVRTISDSLYIGFDSTNGKDVTVLTVGRITGSQMEVIQVLTDDEARSMYQKLTGIKMEEGPGVVPLVWNHNPDDKPIGKVKDITENEDGIIVSYSQE